MCLAAYPEVPQRKPEILLWTVISEAGSRLGADGSDVGRGGSYRLQIPPPQIKLHAVSLALLQISIPHP